MSTSAPRLTPAERQRRYRQRQRRNRVVIRVETDALSLFEALVAANLIDEATEDLKTIAAATALALERWKNSVTRNAFDLQRERKMKR